MNVLILANNDMGLYKFRKELIERLISDKHSVTIALPNGNYVSELTNLGCHFIETDFSRHGTNPISELKIIFLYKKIINNLKPDIVFTYTIKPNIYGGIACQFCQIPYVVNITGLGTAVESPGIMQKITLFLYKKGLRKAQKVFFQNTENRDFMILHKVVKGAYGMLPGSGVNLEQYSIIEYPNGETIDFLFIARVMKEKGIDQYLEAAEYIRAKYPQTRFHVCGACEQDYKERLNELQNKGIITYHGLVNDISTMHMISSCTIHPTYYPEGLSNVLLESCACGRPIITTNRSGCREIVDDSVNGFIIEEKNSRDLITKIEAFLAMSWEEKKQMGLAGRRKVEEKFDRQIVVNNYILEMEMVKK